jgi:glycosyltransferase involved in cell wall biosynthesis
VANLRECVTEGVEVIFVDDGSTDGCGELFKQMYPEGRYFHQENMGVGHARNFGVDQALGDFIQLLDADDTILPGKLQTQLSYLVETDVDLVYSDWCMCILTGGSQKYEPVVLPLKQNDIVESLLGGWWFPTASALIRKSCYQAVGGCDTSLRSTCDDFHLWIQLAIAGSKFGYLSGYYSNYFRDAGRISISNSNIKEFLAGEFKIILNALNALELKGVISERHKNAAAKRLHGVARNSFAIDSLFYGKVMHQIHLIKPSFRPDGSWAYKIVWNTFGHNIAELLALSFRKNCSRR